MKRSITKIPLLGKLVLKTSIFITPPLLISASCYSPNKINKDNIMLDIKNKGSLLSSDVTIHNIEKHAEVSKPEHINLEFESVTQRNNSIEVEYRIINKDKSKSLLNKVVITGFKDSLTNENIIIKPEPIPPINHEKSITKDAETSTNDESSSSSSSSTSRTESETQSDSPASSSSSSTSRTESGTQSDSPASSNSSSTSRTESGTQSDSPASSEPEKANSKSSNGRKIKETGYRLNELTAYRYDLIDVDDDADKAELAKKLNDVITYKNGAIAISGGSFFSKHNNLPLTGLSINKSIKPETKSQINTHKQSSQIGFFRASNGYGVKVEHHGDKNNKKYLFKWHLVREDGNFGSKLYEQIIDLSE
ncbi:MAG1890 family putative lipoprotein [Mycoplasmopsis bovis]|uniref:MAG1890 family putative lipoprotein n=1 Tax=Mycoplasmopsis bovis TaxID=28903 RepID=UPI003D1D4FF8